MSVTNIRSVDLASAPIPQWHDHDQHGHIVHFYSRDSFLLDSLSRFIGTALGAGDAAIVIATESHREGLAERLKARGFDLAAAVKQGRYVPLDAAATLSAFMVDGWPDGLRFSNFLGDVLNRTKIAVGGEARRIAAFGEMVALLWSTGQGAAALHLEQLWNDLAKTHSFSLRCAYPMADFDRDEHSEPFLKICAEHSGVIPEESYTSLSSDDHRLRTITYLQQKAQILEAEVAERKAIEETLRSHKVELQRVVEQRTASLRKLSSQLLISQDSERRRIARELHDSLGQFLVGLKLNIDMLKKSPERADLWLESKSLLEHSIAEVRTISYLLHPPTMDAAGLTSAAQWYATGFSERCGIAVTVDFNEDFDRLPDHLELAIFRVLQEALTNVHRHSGAKRAAVHIHRNSSEVSLEIADDGQGIPPERLDPFNQLGVGMGVGLTGMRERAIELDGVLHLRSDASGTCVRLTIPLTA